MTPVLRVWTLAMALLASARVVQAQAPPPTPAPAPAAVQDPAAANSTLANRLDATTSALGKTELLPGNILRYSGGVQLTPQSGTVKFFADQVDIYIDENRLEATGNVVFADANGRIAAEKVEFDLGKGTGVFHQAFGSMSMGKAAKPQQFAGQDPDVYFYGDTIEKLPERKYRITKGAFTTCVQPTPRWEMTSKSVQITLDDYAFARNSVLRVKGMPLLYLPVVYYPLQEDERATGFLLPTYGTSTYRGQAVSNGFFWAMGRSRDLTLMHDWFTRSGQGAGAEYRYIANAQSSGNISLYGFDRKQTTYTVGSQSTTLPGNTSFEVRSNVNHRISQRLRARARVDYFSDILTQQLYNQDIYQSTRSQRIIDGSVSGTFGRVSASAQYQRNEYVTGIDSSGRTSSSVYGSTPRLAASIAPQMLFGTPIYASATSEYAFIPNKQLVDGRVADPRSDSSLGKADFSPSLRVPLSKLTFLSANTSASYRTTYFSRSLDSSGSFTSSPLLRQYLTLRTEVIGPVLTKIWDTPESSRTERMKHVIEPTFAVDYTTEFANLLRVPRTQDAADYVVGGSTRATYGLNNRLFYRSRATEDTRSVSREFMTIGVQQTYYTNALSSLYDTSYVSYSGRPKAVAFAPIAATARYSPTLSFDANARVEYDVNGNGMQSFSTGGAYNTVRGGANLTFSRTRPSSTSDVSSFLTGSSSLRLREGRITNQYVISWDVARGYIVNQRIATTYMAQCCGIQLEFQKFNYQSSSSLTLPSDRRFNISIVLAGLGSISNFFGAFGGGTSTVR